MSIKKPLQEEMPPEEGATPLLKRHRKALLITGLAALAVVALGAGLIAAVGPSALRAMLSGEVVQEVAAAPDQGGTPPAPPGADMVVMPFQEMIVNISATTDSGRQTSRFLKLDLALVYDKTQDADGLVEARHIFLRDAFQDYLRQLADRDLEGTYGLVNIKGELLRRARAISGSDAPHELLITGLVIQ